jgi:hypothetical protein
MPGLYRGAQGPSMTERALPGLIKRAINETAHLLAQQQYGRLRQELLADALELFYSDASVDEIVRAVRRRTFAAAPQDDSYEACSRVIGQSKRNGAQP